MRLTFRDMTNKFSVFNLGEQPYDMDDQPFKTNLIENLTNEHSEEIKLKAECDAELGSMDLSLDETINSTIEWASSSSLIRSQQA